MFKWKQIKEFYKRYEPTTAFEVRLQVEERQERRQNARNRRGLERLNRPFDVVEEMQAQVIREMREAVMPPLRTRRMSSQSGEMTFSPGAVMSITSNDWETMTVEGTTTLRFMGNDDIQRKLPNNFKNIEKII